MELTPNSNLVICKTPSSSSKLAELENIRGLDHTNDLFYVKIYIHILRKEQAPFLGQSIENVNRLMKVLYEDFDPLDFYFVWDGNIDYIINNTFFDDPIIFSDSIFNTNNHQDGIDIYLFDDLDINGFGLANGIGDSSEILLGGYWLGDQVLPLSRLKVISHEIGHVFFLWHTHHGTDLNDNIGDPNACAELVNGDTANRSQCGDYISDTPADPNIAFNANRNTCAYEGGGFDANGDNYQPDTGNLMSYTYPTCLDGFTQKQKSRMKNAFWYINNLYDTHLDEYTYVRALSINDCFVCGNNLFEITSTLDISQLTVSSSNNIQATIISTSSNDFTLQVTSLLGDYEGQPGYFSVFHNNVIVATQPVWVGKPQTVPANTLTGNTTVIANQEFSYGIGLENRLDGIETYGWVFPEPNEEIDNYNNPIFDTWQHLAWDKYFSFTGGLAGNQTGYVKVVGVNPCGVGDDNDEKICVLNLDDPEGDTECFDNGPPPPIVYYPNPADSLLEVDLSLQEFKIFTVVIYNENQIVQYSQQSTNVVKTVNVSNLSNGTYYLHIYDNNNVLILSRILIINH